MFVWVFFAHHPNPPHFQNHFSQAREHQQSQRCVPTRFMKIEKHTQKDTQLILQWGTLRSLSSATVRRICKGEEDTRNVPSAGKASAGISTLLDPRKSNHETQSSRIPSFVSSSLELLVTSCITAISSGPARGQNAIMVRIVYRINKPFTQGVGW